MEIPDKFIKDFKRIYKKDYGETLSDGQAREMAISVARMFSILSRPPNREKQNDHV